MAAGAPSFSNSPTRRRSIATVPSPLELRPLRLYPEKSDDQHACHVDAGHASCPSRTGDAHGGKAEVSVDQRPIADQVNEVRGDEGEHDRNRHVLRLQITAKSEIREQGQGAPVQGAQERAHRVHQFRADSEVLHQRGPERYEQHQDGAQREGKEQPVDQREARVVQIFAAVGLRDESIESEKQAAAEDRDAVVKALAQAGGADGDGAVGQPPHHDGVHDTHAHPADLGDDQRQGKAQRKRKIFAQRGVRSGLRFDRHRSCDYINWNGGQLCGRGRLARESLESKSKDAGESPATTQPPKQMSLVMLLGEFSGLNKHSILLLPKLTQSASSNNRASFETART